MSGARDASASSFFQGARDFVTYHTAPEQRKGTAFFLVILAGAFFLRLYFAFTTNIYLDEGSFLYDGGMLEDGNVPYRDYYTRSPLYLLFLACSISLLGKTYLAGRLLSVVFSTLSVVLVYLIAKYIFDKRTALTATALFALSPFTAYQGSLIFSEVPQVFLHLLSFHLLLIGLDRTGYVKIAEKARKAGGNCSPGPNSREAALYLLASGLVLGAAIFVRRTSLLLLLSVSFFLLCLLVKEEVRRRRSTKEVSSEENRIQALYILPAFPGGFILSFLVGFLLLRLFMGGNIFWESFFSAAGFSDSDSNHYYALVHFSERGFYLYLPIFMVAIYGAGSLLSTVLLPEEEKKIEKGDAANIARDGAGRMSLSESPLASLFHQHPLGFVLLGIAYSITGFIFFIFGWGLFHDRYFSSGTLNLATAIIYLVSVLLFLALVFTLRPLKLARALFKGVSKNHQLLLWVWFFTYLVFYSIYARIYQIYIYEMVVPAVILLSHFFVRLYTIFLEKNRGPDRESEGELLFHSFRKTEHLGLFRKNFVPLLQVFFLFLLLALANGYVHYGQDLEDDPFASPRDVSDAGAHVKANTSPGEEIFAANVMVALEANRPLVFNISHPVAYRPTHDPDKTSHFPSLETMNYPDAKELLNYLNRTRVRYIILDPYLQMNYLDHHQELRDFIEENYELDRNYGEISVLVRKNVV